MKQFIYFVILCLCAVLLGSCGNMKKPIDGSIETDSVELYEYVPTVYDKLQEREDLRYTIECESIYLAMPEQILTHMYVTKGTMLSIEEIAEDYIANKQFYHDTILKSMNIQKKYIPDSLPKANNPNNAIKSKDTIPIYDK